MIRNFYLEGKVDGCEKPIQCGPKDGGFQLTIFQRDGKRSRIACVIFGQVVNGCLVLTIRNEANQVILQNITERGK